MKKNKNYIFLYIFFISLLIPSIFINFLSHRSVIIQTIMTNDLNNNKQSETVLSYLPNFNTDIPNLSFTSIPIKALVARYYRFQGKFDEALSLLDESKNDNPYIKFNEAEKAEIYDLLQVKDSFKYYSEIAFNKLPRNQRHWIQYLKAMSIDKDTLKIDEGYNLIKDKTDQSFYTIAYLSTNLSMNRSSENVVSLAKQAKNKFINDEDLRLAADYFIYGKVKVDSAIALAKEGQKFFQTGIYDKSSKSYIAASKLNPGDYTHHENAGLSLIREKKHDLAIPFFEYVIDSLNPKNGKSEYLLASIYEIKGDISIACELLGISASYNFPLAFDARVKTCAR